MKLGQNWLEIDDRCFDYAQLELFPLDSWGATQSFSVIDWPHEAIARAMVGPLRLGDLGDCRDDSLWCLVVAADGEFAACISLGWQQLGDAKAMWEQVARELDQARRRPLRDEHQRAMTPNDCLRAWSNPEFWITPPTGGDPVHRSVRSLARLLEVRDMAETVILTDEQRIRAERDAQASVAGQVAPAVLSVLRSLGTELFELIGSRQGISISVVHRLLALARQHGPAAVPYTLQAIKTESLPLLHLAASGYPPQESQQVREALFSGYSLPSTLAEMGVVKAAHRRSLRRSSSGTVGIPGGHDELSELPLSGADWLAVMRAVKTRLVDRASDWSELRHLVAGLFSLDVRDPATAPKLLRWCIAPGYRQSRYRLERLVSLARTIQKAATRLTHVEPTLDQAISLAMTPGADLHGRRCRREAGDTDAGAVYFPRDAGQLAMLVSRISGQSIEQLTSGLFVAHPGMPSGLHLPAGVAIQALRSLPAIVGHGRACGNCLQDAERAIQYVADGLALYAVSVNGEIEGTVALRGYGFNRCQKVGVCEVTGVDNTAPSPELSEVAAALADGWTTVEQMTAWLFYERACEGWKRSMD